MIQQDTFRTHLPERLLLNQFYFLIIIINLRDFFNIVLKVLLMHFQDLIDITLKIAILNYAARFLKSNGFRGRGVLF
jgi:hypothetical protein